MVTMMANLKKIRARVQPVGSRMVFARPWHAYAHGIPVDLKSPCSHG